MLIYLIALIFRYLVYPAALKRKANYIMLLQEGNRLSYRYDAEIVWIDPWGDNAFRVRATKHPSMPTEKWAPADIESQKAQITMGKDEATITNGKITANVTARGKIKVFDSKGRLLLEEYARHRRDVLDPKCSAIEVEAREFKGIPGGDYHLTARTDLELAHRNSQASVPFALSSLGYGFLWNNPGVGRAVLGKNIMSFEALSTKIMDYWIVAGNTPAEIEESYAKATGTVPMMPEYGLGFWQCKLRYQTQEELLQVAREYKRRQLPIDLIVIDFFHWPKQGEWKFDPLYWPDPDAMIRELKDLDIELMVFIWPTVDTKSENYAERLEQGLLIRTDRGIRIGMDFEGNTIHFDATNPDAQAYLWNKAKTNYYDKGIKTFWLDEAEPEYTAYDFDNYRYHLGSNLAIGNIYPVEYARTFYNGQTAAGQTKIVKLIRCAWAGSQKFGALVWSGDIVSSWPSFRNQLAAGLNMGLAGLPWWTTDIGGFHGGDPNDPAFRELFVRWFQWGAFCPVMRLHGDREPRQPQQGTENGATCRSGADNEVWSYGPKVYEICKKYMLIRERLREYTRSLMKEAHEKGTPITKPLFYDFPEDGECWEVETQYLYGPKYLCAPVLEPEVSKMEVYFPKGAKWKAFEGKEVYEGGQRVEVECPLDGMPVFERL